MHSRSKIQRKYPWILPYLPLLYGQSKHASIRSNNGTVLDGEAFMQTDSRRGSTYNFIFTGPLDPVQLTVRGSIGKVQKFKYDSILFGHTP